MNGGRGWIDGFSLPGEADRLPFVGLNDATWVEGEDVK